MPDLEIVDDKSQHCIPFLLERLRAHAERHRHSADADADAPPFFLGLNGVQGAGKTVLVCLNPDPISLYQSNLGTAGRFLTRYVLGALTMALP